MPHLIEEITSVKEALEHFSYDTLENTWLVLDLDNTVMESTLDLGSDQWFSVLFSHGMKSISDPQLAKAAIFVVYHEVQHHIRTQPVESKIPLIIAALQNFGVRVLGLTARGEPIMIPTLRQLNDIGIDFSINAIEKEASTTYSEGIIFCDGQDKGVALADFLKDVPVPPEHVVMLDDKGKHLAHVSQALKPLNIHFSGLRYGHLDQKVSEFDMQKANEQLRYLIDHLPRHVQAAIGSLNLLPPEAPGLDKNSVDVSHHFFHYQRAPSRISELSDLTDISELSSSSDSSRAASVTF